MEIIKLRKKIDNEYFSNQTIYNILKEQYRQPNIKINKLVKSGDIISLKKGFYIFGETYRKERFYKEPISNILYGPSYISFEYALSFYNMIPEYVPSITSAITTRSKSYETSIGSFFYRQIPSRVYDLGITWIGDNNRSFFIASIEKALCDKVYIDKGILFENQKDVFEYLEYDLRVDIEELLKFDIEKLEEIVIAYKSHKLMMLYKAIKILHRRNNAK
ncbi:MAG: hypothetical protein U9N59_09735 [Campylobacterota bacterium]|nr:hypothetical protein [Campylobacterota bacterium]